jgi:type IV pilus assembly protein PilC
MAVFKWRGRSPSGATLEGEMTAPTRDAVIARLRSQRIRPDDAHIREKGKGLEYEIALPSIGPPVSARDLVLFTRQLATMIDAGLPVVQCLATLATQAPPGPLRSVIEGMQADVEAGGTLADAARKHPRVFDDLYASMVQAGEIAGQLDTILVRLASYLEKTSRLKRRIRGAMIYPACVVTAGLLVTIVLLIWVVPVFAEVFSSVGKQLPAPTRFVIALSRGTVDHIGALIAAAAALALGARRAWRTTRGRQWIDRVLLRTVGVGALVRKSAVARFTRTLATLVSSGVPILEALAVTARTAGNAVVESAVLRARASIAGGHTIAGPLGESGVFPPLVCQMVAVGEATGALDAMLQRIADFYDEDVDDTVADLAALLEPAVIAFLGVLVGGLVVSMYLPIFQLGTVLD